MSVNALVPLLTALIGALAAWAVVRYQLGRQETREKRKVVLEKLEELYELVSKFEEWLVALMLGNQARNLEHLASGLIPKELMPSRPRFKPEPVSEDRIEALIGFYASELRADWKKIQEASGDLTVVLYRSATTQVLQKLNDKELNAKEPEFSVIIQKLEKIGMMCTEMKGKIVQISESYR